jgi:hypothetical protein
MMTLMDASKQWRDRPDDERFWTLPDLLSATERFKNRSQVSLVSPLSLEFTGDKDSLTVTGEAGTPASVGFFALGQFCRLMSCPADYVRSLPADLAALNLNNGLFSRMTTTKSLLSLLLTRNDNYLHCRAALTGEYTRIWNSDVVRRLQPLTDQGWRVTPARREAQTKNSRIATENDVGPWTLVKPGEEIAPSGLYASDKDMFVFMINTQNPINETLYRGFFLENSEIGDRSWKLTTFLFNVICGNHIVWGSQEVEEFKTVHRGDYAVERAFDYINRGLKIYANLPCMEDHTFVEKSMNKLLGPDYKEVSEFLWSRRITGLTQSVIDSMIVEIENHPEDRGSSSPTSVWAAAQAISRVAQREKYADSRVNLERVAGKVLSFAE